MRAFRNLAPCKDSYKNGPFARTFLYSTVAVASTRASVSKFPYRFRQGCVYLYSGEEASGLTITIWRIGKPCCILGLPNKLKEKNVNKKYIVKLTAGKAAARKLLHARILLKADASPEGPGWTDEHISEALEVSITTIGRVRQQFVEQGLTAALERRLPCGYRPHRLDGEAEAHLIALACSPAPAGHAHWTIRLLAAKVVELGYVERVGRETIRQVLKKTNSSRGALSNTVFLLKPMPPLSAKWKRY